MLNQYFFVVTLLFIVYYISESQGHQDEAPYCSAELDSINTRNHFISDDIEDPTGGFFLTIKPKEKNTEVFSPDFTITLDSTKYKTLKGLLLYVEHENQTTFTDEDDYNLRLGYFIDIKDQYFRPKSCGVKSLKNSTLEHFNPEDKPLPQTFTWTLKNVFDYENDFHGVVKALAVVSMYEWGVPSPIKFQPKNLIKEIYPEYYEKYISTNYSFTKKMKIHIQQYYTQNSLLFIIFLVVGILLSYYLIRLITKKIKLFKRNRKYEEYHKLENIKTQNSQKIWNKKKIKHIPKR